MYSSAMELLMLIDVEGNRMRLMVFYVFYKLMNGPWPRDVCTLLSNYGFGEVFLNIEKVNICVFGESVLTR